MHSCRKEELVLYTLPNNQPLHNMMDLAKSATGVLLMWQHLNLCMYPARDRAAFTMDFQVA